MERKMTPQEQAFDLDYLNGLLRQIINGQLVYANTSKREKVINHIRWIIILNKLHYNPETAQHDPETQNEKLKFMCENYQTLKNTWKM